MIARWPASLPDFVLVEGFSETPRMPKVAFQPDTGPAIERRKGTMRLHEIPVQTIMTDEQVETLEHFIETELAGATQPFLTKHPRTEEAVKVKIEGDRPYQLTSYTPETWKVAMTLLVIG